MKRRSVLKAGIGLASMVGVRSTSAQSGSYPNRLIKIIVPHAAGGSPDVMARVIATKLSQAVGQPVIIDNRFSSRRRAARYWRPMSGSVAQRTGTA